MSFPRDTYPYTNFHELNLGYFIVHFREIFSQWADLYDQMLDWKDATTDELAAWKTGVEADLDQRETALRAELETWKAQTGQDIAGWEDATLATLTAWQTATQAVFEAIRVEAAGSATAAAASAGDAATAKTAAETAQAAAEAAAASIASSAADISDLKTQFDYLTDNGIKRVYLAWEPGSIDGQTGGNVHDDNAVRTVNYIAKDDIALWDIQAHSGSLYVVRYNYSDGSYTMIGYNQRTSTGDFTTWLKSLEGTHFRFEVFTASATPNDWMTTCYITALVTKEDEEKINNRLDNLEDTVLIESSFNPPYQQGYIRSDGTLGNANDICRTGYLNLGSSNIIITPKTGYKIKVAEYNRANDSSTFTRFLVGPDDAPVVARFESISGKYYIAQISSVDGSAVTKANIPVDAITISYITFTDKTLLIPDKAADAKTVGDKFTELWQDVETIHNEIGYGDISFAVNAGVNHSSYADVLHINIPTGAKFHVDFSGNVSGPQIYAIYSDDTNGRLIIGFTYDGVAAKDITGIGVFISGSAIPSDTTVKTVAYTTESIYGKTTRIPDEKTIVTTVLGANLPGDISGYGVSSAYATEMKNAIDAWMGDYAGDTKKVPFIVHTDQHGRLTAEKQGLFNLLDWLANWEGISAIFNLGDTVVDHWENDTTNTNPLLRNATLESARICTKNIPNNKQINVYGNHDTWYSGTLETAVSGVLPSLQYNNPYFTSDGLTTKMLDDNSGNKVIYDAKNNVKYLVVAGWDYADKPSGYTGHQWYWINKAHIEWIISQMAENDGYDLVLVSHVPLEIGGTGSIDPISGTSIEAANPVYITHGTSFLLPLWNARKAKTQGSIPYNGETIPFNFTSCENDCLCALAGHTHYDGVEYLGGTGLLQVTFDWFDKDTIHFGIIDRRNGKVKCWKLSNDSTPSVDAWEKSFDAT